MRFIHIWCLLQFNCIYSSICFQVFSYSITSLLLLFLVAFIHRFNCAIHSILVLILSSIQCLFKTIVYDFFSVLKYLVVLLFSVDGCPFVPKDVRADVKNAFVCLSIYLNKTSVHGSAYLNAPMISHWSADGI